MASSDTGSAISLEDFVGSAMDGAAWQGSDETTEAPQASTEATIETPGTQPVEQVTELSEVPTDPEGTNELEPTEVDPNAPLAPDPETPQDAENYEEIVSKAPSLSYRVNGQEKTFDEIKVVAGGAIIAEDALHKLQTRLSERDVLYENSQQQYRKYQDLEKLTAWKTTGPDGREQVLTGQPALEAQRVEMAKTTALLSTIAAVFDNPELFSSIVTAKQLPDGRWIATPDQGALRSLTTQAELAAMKAEQSVRQQFQTQFSTQNQPQSQQAPDIQSVAPQVIENTAQQLGVTSLTTEDKAFLGQMLPRFVRAATPEDVSLSPNLRIGEPVVDAQFGQLVQQQASNRANTAKTVQTATTISKENAAKLAAAQKGRTVVQQHLRNAPQRREAPKDQRVEDADNAFAMMQRAASGRF